MKYDKDYALKHRRKMKLEKEFFWVFKLLKPEKNDKILDIGCSTGEFCILLKDLVGCEVIGADVNKEAIIIGRKNSRRNMFVVGDACRLGFKERKFTAITALQLIEHLSEPLEFLKECYRLLEEDGRIIITTPNRFAFIDKLKSSVVGRRFAYDETHVQTFSPLSLRKIVERVGFEVKRILTRGTCLIPTFEKVLNLGWYFPNYRIGSTIFLLAFKH